MYAAIKVPGDPSIWRWTVKECSESEYDVLNSTGAHSCVACPPGGECKTASTLDTVVALPGWWGAEWPAGSPLTPSSTRAFYRCPLRSSPKRSSCLGGNASSQCDVAHGFATASRLCAHCIESGWVRNGAGCSLCKTADVTILMAVGMCLAFCGFVCWEAHRARTESDVTGEEQISEVTEAAVQRIVITHVVTMASLGNLGLRSSELLQVRLLAATSLVTPSLPFCTYTRCKTSTTGLHRRCSAQWTC